MKRVSRFWIMLFCITCMTALIPDPARGACLVDPSHLSELAKRFAPVLVQGEEIPAVPERLLYRAKTSADGDTLYLAYHVVWPFEQDPRPGLYPALTRLTYTGGLRLQRIIFGPGDVEVIGMVIDLETMRIKRVDYEAADYDKKGKVIHVPIVVEGDQVPDYLPLAFRVVSWNHMFELLPEAPDKDEPAYRLRPQPFTSELWRHYRMTKKIKGPLSKDRAHFPWELSDVCL